MISPEFTRRCAPIALALAAWAAPVALAAGEATVVSKIEPEFPRPASPLRTGSAASS